MARIRTIKPEFPQSETIGALSRDARLLFIQLWTIVDDDGRARAASRMLASLLYPYDDDAPKLMDQWLAELEQAGCIRRYTVDGSQYLDLPTWLKHQKIDKPSRSKLPPFGEVSATPREHSRNLAPDLGPRTMDQEVDQDREDSSLLRAGEGATPNEFSALFDCLVEAGDGVIDDTRPRLMVLAEPRSWLAAGADLDSDILPVVRAMCRGRPKRDIRTWAYFTGAIADARERRLAGLPPGNINTRADNAKQSGSTGVAAVARRLAGEYRQAEERPAPAGALLAVGRG